MASRHERAFRASNVLGLREVEQRQRRQQAILGGIAGLLALLAGISYVLVEPTTLLVPILLLSATLLPAVFWYYPRMALFGIFGCAILFEVFQTVPKEQGLTDAVPFFWNINTMFDKFLGSNPKAAPINFFELILIVFSGIMLLSFATRQRTQLRVGSLFWPIAIYLGFVVVGFLNGMSTGGNLNEALQETRAQFYFGIMYVMAVNAIRDRKHVDSLIWLSVICIAFKAFNYIYRHFALFHAEIQDQGVGSHEEAFFFMSFVMLLSVLSFAKVQQKLQVLMWTLLPFVFFANLTTNRRTAYAALTIALPILLLAAYKGFPKARRSVLTVLVSIAVLFPPYFIAFKDKDGAIAGPARAINSAISPNQRDSDSDTYRRNENYDLMFTMRATPVSQAIGYGYGKRFYTPAKLDSIKDIYAWYNLLPHNQILWVWMRLGTLGFLAFWGMVCSILVYACRVIRFQERETLKPKPGDIYPRLVAFYALIEVVLLMVFGLLDLQLSNFRDMVFVAVWVGALAGLAPGAMALNDPEKRVRRPGVSAAPRRRLPEEPRPQRRPRPQPTRPRSTR
ncbi:O-antigen ligase family protein [Armatimonas rosea]|uniref:O-antigen ligase n=1 Tax=Armatimonas rosea TaxID=685828 RepID=A0A7W9W8I5_ARMRO|nr:O-antigen ligase family protein [Armatimonas rosea]MBB6051632.1 O-antigen ligase [Armatimonas rosea]